jgi:ABC-2 type transport system permease protein
VTDTAIRRPPLGLVLRSLMRADFLVLVRSGRTVVLNFATPLLILFITSVNHQKNRNLTFGGPGFVIGMAITYGLVSSSLIGYSATVARDREVGVLQRLRVTPAPTWTIMGSRLIVQLIANTIMTIVALVAGSIVHQVVFTPLGYVLLFAVSLLGGAVFLSMGQGLVGLVRSVTTVNAAGRILFIVLILLGLLGASGVLGDTTKNVSTWSPVGSLSQLFSAVLDLGSWSATDTGVLVACFAYVAVFGFIGIHWFRWDPR